ncbi:hypothetical protein NEOLEDRAFT_1135744, partial [Neolentinus lepideus HHB14362 ss-1]
MTVIPSRNIFLLSILSMMEDDTISAELIHFWYSIRMPIYHNRILAAMSSSIDIVVQRSAFTGNILLGT